MVRTPSRWLAPPLAAAAFMLAGCALPRPAVAPLGGVDVPASWSQPAPAGDAALAQWWQRFGDPFLVELITAARAGNTDVRTAQANLRQARALREQAAAALWPVVSASVSAQHNAGSTTTPGNLYEAGFDASWEPDLFGANRAATDAAAASEQASAATLAGTDVSIAAEVAVTYLQLRGAQARAAFARDNLAAQEQTLQIAQWREQAGLGSSLETSQARSAVEQTRAQLPVQRSAIEIDAHALAVLTGRPPAALLDRLTLDALLPQPPQDLAAAFPAETLSHRPDVLAAELQLRAAAARVGQADAQRLPDAQLRGSVAWAATTLGSLGGIGAARSLVAGIAQTLFDAGQRNAQLASQQAAFDAAQEAYRARVLAALQDVEDSLTAVSTARERVDALQSAERATRDAVLLASNRYESGLIDFQTVLDTQRTLLNVQDGVASAQTDFATSHVRLYKALGGGWEPS